MEVIRKIDFLGNFEKADIQDSRPITNINAVIYCYDSGLILLEANQETINHIKRKRSIERESIYGFKQGLSQKEKSQELIKFEIVESNWEIIRPAYEGDYIIKGKTKENFSITAIVWDDTRYQPKLILRELKLNYDAVSSESQIREAKYGLTNLRLFSKISTSFPSSRSQSTLSIVPIGKQQSDVLEATLAAEMILSDLPVQKDFKYYSIWLIFLLAFASGNKVNAVYNFTIYKTKHEEQHTEYWLGSMPDAKKSKLRVIESPTLIQFIEKILPSLNYDIFDNNGLSLALFWYLESFETNVVNTQFICLCTAIEALIKKYSDSINSRLLSNPRYKRVRKSILEILKENGDDLSKTNDTQEKYDIFCKKVEQIFQDGGLNKIGNLGAALQEMLQFYQVYYKDLFPDFDFIKIRNDLVHKGFSEVDEMYETFLKLENLFIRIVLSMLKYEGNYMEHDGTQPIGRSFPLSDDA